MRGDFTINGNNVSEGCVSSGTLRTEDLMKSFCEEVRRLCLRTPSIVYESEDWLQGYEHYLACCYEDPGGEKEFVSLGMELVNDLQDHLDNMAPKGWRFGNTEGDGADFGWWRDEDED